jgi:hypothetical protein
MSLLRALHFKQDSFVLLLQSFDVGCVTDDHRRLRVALVNLFKVDHPHSSQLHGKFLVQNNVAVERPEQQLLFLFKYESGELCLSCIVYFGVILGLKHLVLFNKRINFLFCFSRWIQQGSDHIGHLLLKRLFLLCEVGLDLIDSAETLETDTLVNVCFRDLQVGPKPVKFLHEVGRRLFVL